VASGVTISSCYRGHRHQEFLRFLNEIDANLPGSFDVHLVMDNYGTHKVNKVRTWLARHPRYHVHFTPTSGSWLNLVERLFAAVTERCVRRGSHTTVRALEKAMLDYSDRGRAIDGARRGTLATRSACANACWWRNRSAG
jgi:transposase